MSGRLSGEKGTHHEKVCLVKRFHSGLGLGLLALLLSSCTLYIAPGNVSLSGRVRFGIEVSDVIQVFEPTRGAGATYYVGETLSFRVLTNRDGYLTLSAIDPDGRVYTFARNLFVRGSQVQIIDGPDRGSVFALEPPRGFHRVRASFTPSPTNGRVSYRGSVGEASWTQSISAEVRPYDVRDVAETNFYLR